MRYKPLFRLPVVLVAAVVALSMAAAPALADGDNGNNNNDNNGGGNDNATTCNGTFTGVTLGDVVVPPNGSCILMDSVVNGQVDVLKDAYFQATNTQISEDVNGERAQTVFIDTGSSAGSVGGDKTAQIFVFNATVNGDVDSDHGTNEVEICGSTVKGTATVQDLHGGGNEILIGDPADGCAPNTLKNVRVDHNVTDFLLSIRGNTISGNATVSHNDGPSDKFVQGNNGGKTLKCVGNATPFAGGPNGAWASKQGQCF
jgi:hypothetical protein